MGLTPSVLLNPERVRLLANTYSVRMVFNFLYPWLERSDNHGFNAECLLKPERVRLLANAYSVRMVFNFLYPWLSLRSSHGLKLANAFDVPVYKFQPEALLANGESQSAIIDCIWHLLFVASILLFTHL